MFFVLCKNVTVNHKVYVFSCCVKYLIFFFEAAMGKEKKCIILNLKDNY